jgi:hypothetical protein
MLSIDNIHPLTMVPRIGRCKQQSKKLPSSGLLATLPTLCGHSTSSCYQQIGNLDKYAGLQPVIKEIVYFPLLKKMNSAIIYPNLSEKAKFGH